MAKYATNMKRTASTTASVGSINAPGSGMRRAKIIELIFGSEATPANQAFGHKVQRCTAAGTSTAGTMTALDAADAAAVTVSGFNHTIEPTYTANAILLDIALNQQATLRWVAREGSELVIPATANNGIGFQTPTAPTSLVTISAVIEEQ